MTVDTSYTLFRHVQIFSTIGSSVTGLSKQNNAALKTSNKKRINENENKTNEKLRRRFAFKVFSRNSERLFNLLLRKLSP